MNNKTHSSFYNAAVICDLCVRFIFLVVALLRWANLWNNLENFKGKKPNGRPIQASPKRNYSWWFQMRYWSRWNRCAYKLMLRKCLLEFMELMGYFITKGWVNSFWGQSLLRRKFLKMTILIVAHAIICGKTISSLCLKLTNMSVTTLLDQEKKDCATKYQHNTNPDIIITPGKYSPEY